MSNTRTRSRRRRVTVRRAAFALFVALSIAACSKRSPESTDAGADAGMIVLAPLEQDEPEGGVVVNQLSPSSSPPQSPAKPLPWTVKDRSDELPLDAGDARCPPTDAGMKQASVQLEMRRAPHPSLYVVIPSRGVREPIWVGAAGNPNSCSASVERDGSRAEFHCSEVMTNRFGSLYARGSDVLLKKQALGEETTTKPFLLPCGTSPRFELLPCPPQCRAEPGRCECTELGGPAPPAPTSTQSR